MPDTMRKTFSSYYEVLNVPSDSPQEDIKRAYYALVKQYHPDKNMHKQSVAQNRLQILNEAYEALKSPMRRKRYDDSLVARRSVKHNAWRSSVSNMHADNDNPKTVKPFPWSDLAKVGWSNLGKLLLVSNNKGTRHE